MSNLQAAFEAFASFGAGPQTEMDNAKFIKLCKEAGLIDTKFTTTDADLLFSKIKAKGARKITFSQFADLALPEIATKKKSTLSASTTTSPRTLACTRRAARRPSTATRPTCRASSTAASPPTSAASPTPRSPASTRKHIDKHRTFLRSGSLLRPQLVL
jgi:hypothetical protein